MNSYLRSYKYHDCIDFISGGRDKINRKVENNTYIRLQENEVIVKFHYTDIATIQMDNTIILNSGGYQTFTTKDRFNKILNHTPFRIYQELGIWYIRNYQTNEIYGYADNMRINPDNTVSGYADNIKELEKTRKRIKKYAKKFISALVKGEVESPNAGECWHCLMRDNKTNIPLGESLQDTSHLESHFEDNYFVGSLLYRAVELYPVSQYAMMELGDIWQNGNIPDRFIVLPNQAYKSLVKYLYSQFNLPY